MVKSLDKKNQTKSIQSALSFWLPDLSREPRSRIERKARVAAQYDAQKHLFVCRHVSADVDGVFRPADDFECSCATPWPSSRR